MKHSKDPFEAAIEEEQVESPPESPVRGGDGSDDGRMEPTLLLKKRKTYLVAEAKNKEEEEVELTKYPTSADPVKRARMQTILAQFTEDQRSRYESFRRSTLQKPIKKLLKRIIGRKIDGGDPINIVASSITKMFVGELVETARIVMRERKESGPISPCHIRESYRRLKLQGKVPKRPAPRLFL